MKRRSSRRGAVVTEFALTLPIVLLFFFAAFEFCRFSMLDHTVENAVYEAARRGVVPGATVADVRTKAQQILATIGVRAATIQVTPGSIQRETPEITVQISVPFDQNSFVPTRFLAGRTLQRSLTLQRENVR